MKRANLAIAVCVVLLILAVSFLLKKTFSSRAGAASNAVADALGAPSLRARGNVSPVNTQPAANPVPAVTAGQMDEQKSLQTMVSTLAAFASSQRSIDELMQYLQASKQNPVMIEDKNDYTGKMFVVRTNSPFPGTRYFHAQYFQDETGQKFVQHMSFEFKPGPQAMQQALDSVQSTFKGLGNPQQKKADFAMWDLGNGYVLWVKKQSAEDLDNDLMNPSTDADIGTIRVAIEQNPHDEGE